MRERVLDAIYKKLDENPNDVDMQRQLVLINRANISTIHSFCLDVIKNNFYKIDISPNFRLAEGAEIEILKMEILDQVFDDLYEEENQEFLKLLNTYCSYRDDDKLKSIIQKIYKYVYSGGRQTGYRPSATHDGGDHQFALELFRPLPIPDPGTQRARHAPFQGTRLVGREPTAALRLQLISR